MSGPQALYDNTIKNIFDSVLDDRSALATTRSTSPLNTPRTRSNTSSTSSACSSSSSSSFEFNVCEENQTLSNQEVFSPPNQQPIRTTFGASVVGQKNLGNLLLN